MQPSPVVEVSDPRAMSQISMQAIVDLRCLQDTNYVARGIGRHTVGLLKLAPRCAGRLRLIGLIDPVMQPPPADVVRLCDDLVPNAYAAEHALSDGERIFISPSPMTHPPDFVARLIANSSLRRIAIVHDFIPLRHGTRYLPGATERLGYVELLRWLTRFDLFATNSGSTADDLAAMLAIPPAIVVATGCALDPIFEPTGAVQTARRHIFVAAGADARKNPELAIRAHARSASMQDGDGVPLVIGGNYASADKAGFRRLAVAHNGRDDLIVVPGQMTDGELVANYREALAVITPSRDEGFSLPIIEGMACGALCLASDIPAHRELVRDPDLRFAPDDDTTLSATLDRLVRDGGWRQEKLSGQASIWPRFSASRVAERFWMLAIPTGNRLPTPAVQRAARPRVALLTPLPPDRSGVADYTAASCAELGRLVDLHLFTETRQPTPRPGAASIRPMSELPHLMPGFDRVISVVGNSHYHTRIFEMLMRYGGACIAHDARMLGFYGILLGRKRALETASRELGRPVNDAELDSWFADEGQLKALFLGDIAAAARPMIVHSPVTAELCRERYGVTPAYLPFSIYRPWRSEELGAAPRAEARARMGVGSSDMVVTTFGFVHPSKAPEECVWALDSLRRWGMPARLHFVGDASSMPDGGRALRHLIDLLDLSGHVRLEDGYVSEQTYRDHLVGSDLAIQLRTYGLGGLSGALLDCAAAGLPTVANRSLGDAVGVPADYIRTINDAISPLLLAEALADLRDSENGAAETSRREQARRKYGRERSFAAYASGLCAALDLDLAAVTRSRAA